MARYIKGSTTYTREKATEILSRIAKGKALWTTLKEMHMGMDTWYSWLNAVDTLKEEYAQAKEASADHLADEITELSDAAPRMIDGPKGQYVDSGWVQWQKNRVEARKWIAAKLKPKKYGEHLNVDGEIKNLVLVEIDTHAKERPNAIEGEVVKKSLTAPSDTA